MSNFLLELRSEEIPARMQAGARADLEKLLSKELEAAGVVVGELTVWSTPRRLALIARGLPAATAAVSEEVKGPRVGAPPQALEGFLRKTGLSEDQLTERDGVLFAVTEKPGRATAEVLAEAIPAIVRAFPWPKSQRWGAASLSSESLRWVRPLSAIVALLDGAVVDCAVGGIKAGRTTRGHRFHSAGEISIDGVDDYAAKLRSAHVIVDHVERQDIVRAGAAKAAADAGLTLVEDEGLAIENAGLTEWPVPLLGRFDPAFLDVPPEVIQLTARTNQKYFVCTDNAGKLANAFVCTANIAASDGGAAIGDGNRKVLAARLSDARFFWEQDRKVSLEDQAKKLSRITFHEKLGTVADKVERVAKLARWLVEEGIVGSNPRPANNTARPEPVEGPSFTSSTAPKEKDSASTSSAPSGLGDRAELADQAELAARLCKADLVTEMVGEFPELQGLMGGYYARAEGLPDAVANAIRDHYKPVGQGDDVPTAPVTVAVSLADKLDTLVGFFSIDERPTGSKDPFALRRAMLGIVELILRNELRIGVRILVSETYRIFASQLCANRFCITEEVDELDAWHPLLGNEGAYLPAGKQILVLKDAPPIKFSDTDERGRQVWSQDEVRQLRLLDFITLGFIEAVDAVYEFCIDRLRDREKRSGRRADLIEAVMPRTYINPLAELGLGFEATKVPNPTGPDDIVRILRTSVSLNTFIGTEDGANLLAGYKRAANILKKEGDIPANAGTSSREPADAALVAALDAAEPTADAAVAAEDFAAAMAALASLRAPIDRFFEAVMVNDPDPAVRAFRLGLLERFRVAVHKVADFSKIEG